MSLLNFNKVEFFTSFGTADQFSPSERPEIVFSGRSNVGKSSLINKLCNRKNLARVSSTPGKTATINFFTAGEAYLVDLPGYGYAKVSASERRKWDKLIDGYFNQNRDIRMLVQLIDSRHAPSKDDIIMLEYLAHHGIRFVVALTKADKNKPSQHARILEEFKEILFKHGCKSVFLTSAEKGFGIEELSEYLKSACE